MTATAFQPQLQPADPEARHWMRQASVRLRREICWLWQERGAPAPAPGDPAFASLPPYTDRLSSTLDLSRHDTEKRRFFASDTTAVYLGNLLAEPAAGNGRPAVRGSFGWAAQVLELDAASRFAWGLALLSAADGTAGAVMAGCLNDPAKTAPTLALAQRLWDCPDQVLAMADPAHPLYRCGLLNFPSPLAAPAGAIWEAPLTISPILVPALLGKRAAGPAVLRPISAPDDAERDPLPPEAECAATRLSGGPPTQLRVLPIVAAHGAPVRGIAAAIARSAGLSLSELRLDLVPTAAGETVLGPGFTLAWLQGDAVLFDARMMPGHDSQGPGPFSFPLPGLPLNVILVASDRTFLKRLAGIRMLPPLILPASTYEQRLGWWRAGLRPAPCDASFTAAVADCARRFRYERETIRQICDELARSPRSLAAGDLRRACRRDLDLGDLAQPVVPRFQLSELMLPPEQTRQLEELIRALRHLTCVHYNWGTARAWNESGLSALFAGPPGTGKSMAAEVVAAALDLPLYRIDLSQVVNKYIGETEKNLRKLFDAADTSDLILFFDEADALFGKRTEVKDAHDRYANLEISYLLERMERSKGLTILATNRKKDLDEAFLRRLRFVLEFPLPGHEERLRIWRGVIPAGVDSTGLDFPFLAQKFPLAGGHIRSIVFQACLQTATPDAPKRLDMRAILAAVKREYEKLDRTLSLDQFGPYADLIQPLP